MKTNQPTLQQIQNTKKGYKFSTIVIPILIMYTLLVVISEVLNVICYAFDIPQNSVIVNLVVILLFMVCCVIFHKYILWKKLKFEIISIVFICIYACLFLFKSLQPDLNYDTLNYHIYNQLPNYKNNITESFFPGVFQTYSFRLADRMFYLFRKFLGYRLGTIFNLVILVGVYVQLIQIVRYFKNKFSLTFYSGKNKIIQLIMNESFLIGICLGWNDVIMQTATYLIDFIAVPFILEMVFIIYEEDEQNNGIFQPILFCLLGGIVFAIKMTNIIYVLPLLIMYLLKIYKRCSLKLIVLCFLIGILPVLPYFIYNYLESGNIVYPYYNEMFKSKYYGITNFRDGRWGPSSFLESLFWSFHIIFYPQDRTSELYNIFPYSLFTGWIAIIIINVKVFKAKADSMSEQYKLFNIVTILFISSSLMWSFTTGYLRYYCLAAILNGVLCIIALLLIKPKTIWKSMYAAIILILLSIQFTTSINNVVIGREWSWRAKNDVGIESFKALFHDKRFVDDNVKEKVDVIVLYSVPSSAYASLINHDSDIINLDAIQYLSLEENQLYMETKQKINEAIESNLGVYCISGQHNFEEVVKKIENDGYRIAEKTYVGDFFDDNSKIIMCRITIKD